ncbi:hypothetical protein KFE25_000439 [Diacronema lutheri]|uniref:rRNA methyltransferase 2, mitochondrial n=1 Tax=Diacronema lutheri TaxID=2081491 RepID=A0A8J6CGW8_DIALT|nr:hypothetical protein KFE25_000439 [Diacronema lutheri]
MAGGALGALRAVVRGGQRRQRSSASWLKRQAADPVVAEARRRGLRSRAALKLEEMDRALALFRPGQVVVDLGASPGSWAQVAAGRIGGAGRIIAADLLPIEPLDGVAVLQMDVAAPDAVGRIVRSLGGGGAHVVLNDMAPNTSGVAAVDHLRSVALCEVGLEIATAVLLPGGTLLSKVFMGGHEQALRASMLLRFDKVRMLKPASSRKESREVYVAALGFKPSELI